MDNFKAGHGYQQSAGPPKQKASSPFIRSLQQVNDQTLGPHSGGTSRLSLSPAHAREGINSTDLDVRSPAPVSPKPTSPRLEQKPLPKPVPPTKPKPLSLQSSERQAAVAGQSQPTPADSQQGQTPAARRERQWEPSSFNSLQGSIAPSLAGQPNASSVERQGPKYHVTESQRISTTGLPRLISPQVPPKSMLISAGPATLRSTTFDTDGVQPTNVSGRFNTSFLALTCSHCLQPMGSRTLKALDQYYHPHCFRCTHCHTELEHVAFLEHQGRPYCHLDYHELFSERCAQCGTPIEGEIVRAPLPRDSSTSTGSEERPYKAYHPLHFFCAGCGNPFTELRAGSQEDVGKFIWKEGHPYCGQCHASRYGAKCHRQGCRKGPGGSNIIPDGAVIIKALGSTWHDSCFTCKTCHQLFKDGLFVVNQGEAWHQDCLRLARQRGAV